MPPSIWNFELTPSVHIQVQVSSRYGRSSEQMNKAQLPMTLFKTILTLIIFALCAGAAFAQRASPPVATPDGVATAASVGAAAPPRCDANCVRNNAEPASNVCAPRIAAQSPPDFDWNSRPTQGIFQQADPSSPADAIVHYRGDAVRFSNERKVWVRLSYECAYDVDARIAVSVDVHAGLLDQPPAPTAQPVTDPTTANPTTPRLTSQALAQAIKQAVTQPGQTQQVPAKRPRVWEPSPVEIQQQAFNPQH